MALTVRGSRIAGGEVFNCQATGLTPGATYTARLRVHSAAPAPTGEHEPTGGDGSQGAFVADSDGNISFRLSSYRATCAVELVDAGGDVVAGPTARDAAVDGT